MRKKRLIRILSVLTAATVILTTAQQPIYANEIAAAEDVTAAGDEEVFADPIYEDGYISEEDIVISGDEELSENTDELSVDTDEEPDISGDDDSEEEVFAGTIMPDVLPPTVKPPVDQLRSGASSDSIKAVEETLKSDVFGAGVNAQIFTYEADGSPYKVLYFWYPGSDEDGRINEDVIARTIYSEQYKSVTDLVFDDTITVIASHRLFYDFTNVSHLRLSDRLIELGQAVFEDCKSLEEVTIPATLEEADIRIFENCASLKTIRFADGIRKIPAHVADPGSSDCGVKKVVIPPSVTEIGEAAFAHLDHLETVEFTDPAKTRLARIGMYAFFDTNLSSVSLPLFGGSWTEQVGDQKWTREPVIEAMAFAGISNINFKTLIIPEGVKELGQLSNVGNKWQYIYLPKSLSKKDSMYYALSSSTLPANLKKIYYAGTKAQFLLAEGHEGAAYYDKVEYGVPSPAVVETITADKASIVKYFDDIKDGDIETVMVSVSPANHLETEFNVTTGDATIATASEGTEESGRLPITITFRKKIGTTKITVRADRGSAEINVTVKEKVKAEKPYGSPAALREGDEYSLYSKTPNAQIFYIISNGKSGSVAADLRNASNYSKDAQNHYSAKSGTGIKEYKNPLITGKDFTSDKRFIHAVVVRDTLGFSDVFLAELKYGLENKWGTITNEDREELNNNTSNIPEGVWVPQSQIEDTALVYTGKAVTIPGLRVYLGNTLLAEKKDYTLGYKNNTNAGVAKIEVRLTGNYSGTAEFGFELRPAKISADSVTYTPAELNVKLVGGSPAAQSPDIKLKNGKTSLKKDIDYTIGFKKSGTVGTFTGTISEAGTYDVLITGEGNYDGIIQIEKAVSLIGSTNLSMAKVTVKKIPDQNIADWKDKSYKVTPAYEVTYKGAALDSSKYTARFVNNEAAGTATLILNGTGVSGSDGMAFLGRKTTTFKIKGITLNKTNLTASFEDNFTYNGKPVDPTEQPEFAVKYNSTALVKDKDYTVAFNNAHINAGKVNMTIAGAGIYTGKVTFGYTIKKADFSGSEIQIKNANLAAWDKTGTYPYTKNGVFPVFAVYDSNAGKFLTEADFSFKYVNNKAPAKYDDMKAPAIEISGKGNYAGKRTETFSIDPSDIGMLTMELEDMVEVSKANKFARKAVIRDTNGAVLKAGTDYEKELKYFYDEDVVVTVATGKGKNAVVRSVLRQKGDEVDKADVIPAGAVIKVEAYGKNNYTGLISNTFTVAVYSVKDLKFILNQDTFEYTGREIRPGKDNIRVQVKSNGKWVFVDDSAAGRYFDITGYSNNIRKGSAKIMIRAKNNYAGNVTLTFKIKPQDRPGK